MQAMLNQQKSWPSGGARQPRRSSFAPADSRARVVRRPPPLRAANDNEGGSRLLRLVRPLATAAAGLAILVVAGALLV